MASTKQRAIIQRKGRSAQPFSTIIKQGSEVVWTSENFARAAAARRRAERYKKNSKAPVEIIDETVNGRNAP